MDRRIKISNGRIGIHALEWPCGNLYHSLKVDQGVRNWKVGVGEQGINLSRITTLGKKKIDRMQERGGNKAGCSSITE